MCDATVRMLEKVDERLLRHGILPDTESAGFKTWMTIKVGMHKYPDVLRCKITSSDCTVSSGTESLMGQESYTLVAEEMEMHLVKTSARELGFTRKAFLKEVCDGALKHGLWGCYADVGPELRWQYKGQPQGEILRVTSLGRIADKMGRPRNFVVLNHCGIEYLDNLPGWDNTEIEPDDLLVFWRPSKNGLVER